MKRSIFSALLTSLALLSGCASTSATPVYDDVAQQIRSQSGHDLYWNAGSEDTAKLEAAVDGLLAQNLTVDAAVQLALLKNPSLQAKLEDLAVGQADLVQAGLLKNPVFSLGQSGWEDGLAPNLFASVEQDFLDVVTMPMRKRVAATELEASKLDVADHVLELAARVREAFYRVQAAEQTAAVASIVDEASSASAELARRQYEAGTLGDLALSSELARAAQTSLLRKRVQGEAAVLREELNKQMGLWGARTAWKLGARLPDLPAQEVSLEHLETVAIEQRLDLGAARRNLQALRYALDQVKTTRWTGVVNVSVEAGRRSDTHKVVFGPTIALEIPLFDQRQAQVARLEAFERQAAKTLEALAIDARADVRATRARLLTARAVAEDYGKVVMPLQDAIVRFTQEHYDSMLLGVYHLLDAKQEQLHAYQESIEALRDYWIARSDLERAVGRRLTPAARTQGEER